ncbi:uncharacterized protein LOC113750728 [Coffea eugenioides]|uniref:uncharacterized protein LOC113750728 n=1 Tax=Coffea eugenioides TaxID=49369 RepID=UPI000F608471|nr:uncharacterized protein LOC113750728 [Coffea eugenioides]
MFGVRSSMEIWLKWDLSRGDVAFWWDNWSGLGPLAWRFPDLASNTRVQNFLCEGQWDHLTLATFPSEVAEAAADSFFCFGKVPDSLVWTLEPSGDFSTKLAYQVVRSSGVQSWAFASVWHSLISPKLSFLMWRLLHEQLSVDNVLEKFQLETLQHVFATGALANEVWGLFGQSLGFATPSVASVYFLAMARLPLQWAKILDSLSGVRRSLVSTLVRWVCPSDGFFKLNTNGCSTLRGGGGGGVFSDSCERLILAFADFFGPYVMPEYYQFKHCYREGNAVTDSLASYGTACGSFELYTRASQLPCRTKGLLALDMQNFFNFRFSFQSMSQRDLCRMQSRQTLKKPLPAYKLLPQPAPLPQ